VVVPHPVPPLSKKAAKPKQAQPQRFVWIEQVIAANLESLFPGLTIVESIPST